MASMTVGKSNRPDGASQARRVLREWQHEVAADDEKRLRDTFEL